MLATDLETRLDDPLNFVCSYERGGKTPRDFWNAFDASAGDLHRLAWADDADPELRERFTEILACADDAGFAVPEEFMDHAFQAQ